LNASTGAFIDSWRFGGEAHDQPNAIAGDGAGGVLVAGYVNRSSGGTADFPDGTTHTSTSSDIAVLRFATAASASLQPAQSVARESTASTGDSMLFLDAATIDQLLAEPNSKIIWTRKSRFKIRV
jgi:hypothetical protein